MVNCTLSRGDITKKFGKEEVVKLLLESSESDVEPSSKSSDFADARSDADIHESTAWLAKRSVPRCHRT